LRPLVVRFLDDGVQRVEVRIAGRHGLPRPRRDDARRHHALLLGQRIVLSRHILLLAHQAIETFDVVGTELVPLEISIDRLGVRRVTSHVLQLDMIRIEVLDDPDVVTVLVGERHGAVVHHRIIVHIGLHVGRHL